MSRVPASGDDTSRPDLEAPPERRGPETRQNQPAVTQMAAGEPASIQPSSGGTSGERNARSSIEPVRSITTMAFEPPVSGSTPSARVADGEWPTIGGYEILGLLGKGGMGRVYKARQTSLKRLVALKVIRAGDDAEPDQIARFREEAQAIARLQHPNIVQIYEVGEEDGQPFFSLELVEGGSLAQQLRGIPLPVRQAAELVETLARAIHAAHQQGIIHRDLKPANVLLAPPAFVAGGLGAVGGWVPKITDFGLAKKLDDSAGLTVTGAVMGTPRYMAPEQAAGRSRDISPAVDIYALGVILYELLTGRTPFRGTTLEVLDQVRHEAPQSPRRLEPEIPASLETICLKCLEKDPARRYTSASALAADLRRFLEDKPILARPVGPVGRLVLWTRRNKLRLAGAILVAAAVGLTWFGAARWQAYRLEERERERLAREQEWKDYQLAHSQELFEKLLTDGPSTWPMPAEEKLIFQNGLHDLQVRKNRASIQSDEAEVQRVEAQLRRAEPLLRRVQLELPGAEQMGLQIPAVTSVRTAASKMKSQNNLRQLSLAMHNYANVRRGFPPHAIYSRDGKPLLSWRVALLPYLDQAVLFRRFKLDEPWDSPHNQALLKYMPLVYISPEDRPADKPYSTYYQVFVGTVGPVGPVFEPTPDFQPRLGMRMPDGNSGTLLMVESGPPVPWTKPEDIPYDPAKPLPRLGGLYQDGFPAAFADSSIKFLTRDLDEETLRALITRNGGEPVEWTKLK
jgi:serine/threonine protein kinase